MRAIETTFWLFFGATLVAVFFGAYLIESLKSFPEEYRRAGSPAPFWNNAASWSFLGYVLGGRFATLPDASLVRSFNVYRAMETLRVALFALFLVLLLTHEVSGA